MSTKIVYASADCVVRHHGLAIRLVPGEPWDADDPFVRQRPDLFRDVPDLVHRTVAPVEQATAGPGERRMTKRA
jgi:hypothetical protein